MSTDPAIPQKMPFVQDEEPGTKAWCSCGHSKSQPFCDGGHAGTDFRPTIVKVEAPGKVAWCGCKQTKTPPYCDGSHANL